MDTKSLIISISTTLFQQKGYIAVGLNEILKACDISKGALYHHFPNGKEELLIACLESLNEVITKDIEEIFAGQATTQEAAEAMIKKLILDLETKGTVSGYTFSSIVSEMASLSDPVRDACARLYQKMQDIYLNKLVADGFAKEQAYAIAVMLTASIEGAMLLCLTQQATEPLSVISGVLPKLLKGFTTSE